MMELCSATLAPYPQAVHSSEFNLLALLMAKPLHFLSTRLSLSHLAAVKAQLLAEALEKCLLQVPILLEARVFFNI